MLDAYFSGDYKDSKLCIPPDASVAAIVREVLIQLLQVLLLGAWQAPANGILASIVRVPDRGTSVHASRQRKTGASALVSTATGSMTGTSWSQYLAAGPASTPASAKSAGDDRADSSESEWDADFFELRGEENNERATRARSQRWGSLLESSDSLLEMLLLEEDQILKSVRRWQHFMDIPKVRFVLYSIFYVLYLVLMMMVGAGPFPSVSQFPYVRRTGTWYNFHDTLGSASPQSSRGCCGSPFWALPLWRWHSSGRRGCATTYAPAGTASMRSVSSRASPRSSSARLRSATWRGTVTATSTSSTRLSSRATAISSPSRSCYCRATELLSYSPYVGEYIDILTLMVAESGPILLIVFIAIVTFGIAFSTLELPSTLRPDTLRRPLFEPMWALMGDFSVDDYYDRMGTNMFPVYPILLFTYLFLTTIFLVNLLIAQVWGAQQES